MNEHRPVHQVEYRWRKGKDFSPIAASFELNAENLRRLDKLGDSVRPHQPNAAIGAPAISIAYRALNSAQMAFVWRRHDINAVTLEDAGERRPLVARMLFSDRAILTPAVAMTLGWIGVDAVADPRPGQVSLDAVLPAIDPSRLAHAADSHFDKLDDRARNEHGLARLVAAALQDWSNPLAVQLPAHDVANNNRAAQLLLLWGLWRITAPILEDCPGARPAPRGWTFSSYEPALGATETSQLPEIVFRAQLQSGRPQVKRTETVVQPRAGEEGPPLPDEFIRLGGALVAEYEKYGGQELDAMLRRKCKNLTKVEDRLVVLNGWLAPAATSVKSSGSDVLPPVAEPAEPVTTERPTVIRQREPVAAIEEVSAPPVTQLDAIELESGQLDGEDRGQMTALLDQLAAGSGAAGFDRAILALRGDPQCTWPEDRQSARRLLDENEWYIRQLAEHDPSSVERLLSAIFQAVVIPDLSDPAVHDDVAEWALAGGAPPVVILALIAASHSAGNDKAELLAEIIRPSIYWRWQVEQAGWVNPVLWPSARESLAVSSGRAFFGAIALTSDGRRMAAIFAFLCLLLALALLASVWP
jgi:hypothetical protein